MRKLVLSLLLVSLPVWAGTLPDLTSQIEEVSLSNGMKFLIYPRGDAPIFSAYVRFRVGGIEEVEGATGLAHLLEHMAFKGTETVGTTDFKKEKPILEKIEMVGEDLALEYRKGKKADPQKVRDLRSRLRELHQEQEKVLIKEELAKKFLEMGGNDQNATTSKDMTSYFVSLPAEKLRDWAELESERIFKPVFREFYEERDVVLEERRMRVENNPDGRLYEAFLKTAFTKSPYRWPTIGLTDDILQLSVRDLRKFWQRYYHPSNAVGVLVGKLDPEKTRKVLEETFGRIVLDEAVPSKNIAGEPPQGVERRVSLKYAGRSRLWIGFHKPTLPSDEDYIFDLIDEVLGGGRSSRLYKSLVLDQKIASDVDTSTGIPGARLPNLFLIEVNLLPSHTPDEALRLIDAEVKKLKEEGPSTNELEKAKNRLAIALLRSLKTNEGLASQLSYFEVIAGNWRYMETYLDKIARFGREDIQRVAKDYLKPDNRTVGMMTPQ